MSQNVLKNPYNINIVSYFIRLHNDFHEAVDLDEALCPTWTLTPVWRPPKPVNGMKWQERSNLLNRIQ
jgi:hypothetical protein